MYSKPSAIRWIAAAMRGVARMILGDCAASLVGNAACNDSRFAQDFARKPRTDIDVALRISMAPTR